MRTPHINVSNLNTKETSSTEIEFHSVPWLDLAQAKKKKKHVKNGGEFIGFKN